MEDYMALMVEFMGSVKKEASNTVDSHVYSGVNAEYFVDAVAVWMRTSIPIS